LAGMIRLIRAVYILWIVLFSSKSWAKRTDIVFLKNGDCITGEVQELRFGKSEYRTDDVGTVFIEWEIVKDFFWNLNLYDQFDSEPLTDNAAKNDWGVVLSVGVDILTELMKKQNLFTKRRGHENNIPSSSRNSR